MLHPEQKSISRQHWVHFLPVIIEFLFSNYVKSQNFYWDGNPENLSWAGRNSYVLWMHTPLQYVVASGLILYYALRSKKMVRVAQERTEGWRLSRQSGRRTTALLNLYSVFSITVLTLCLVDFCFFNYAFNPFYVYPLYAGMALITYWLGLQGILFRNESNIEKISMPIQDAQLQEIADRLEKIMKERKPYLDPALNISSLAEISNTKPYLLTKALNGLLGKTFNDYVSEYRVGEFMEKINDPAFDKYTLLAIAYESGFNSKATYNRAVKRLTGQSPRELRKAAQTSSE